MSGLILILLLLIFFVFVLPVMALNRSTLALREVEALQRQWTAWRTGPGRASRHVSPGGAEVDFGGGGMPESYPQPSPAPPSSAAGQGEADKFSGQGGTIQPVPGSLSVPTPYPPAQPRPVNLPVPGVVSTPPALPLKVPASQGGASLPADPEPGSLQPAPAVPRQLNLEQFLGVKLFAWLGGLALFLGVVFFVKYAFERNLIPPAVRTAMGFVTGLALTGGGLMLHRRKSYEVLSRTLCATGMVVLYGVTYAAHALYKFPLFSAVPTFLLMAVITVCSFGLAVRLKALEVAFLGMLGGFLAPVLCSTGQDNPAALFISTALLDIGLLAVARRCRWFFLASFAALGTVFTQFGWVAEFFAPEFYSTGWKTWTVGAVFLAFPLIFITALRLEKPETAPEEGNTEGAKDDHSGNPGMWLAGSALGLLTCGMLAGFLALIYPEITVRPVLLHGFILLTQVMVMAVGWMRPECARAVTAGALAIFLHLLLWTAGSLTTDLLPWALGSYLTAGLAHVGYVLWWERRKDSFAVFSPGVPWIPPIIQILTILPVVKLNSVPAMVWPFLLALNVLGIGLAARRQRLTPVLLAGVVTLLNGLLWLKALPPDPARLAIFPPTLAVYILVLLPALLWLGRHAEPAEKQLAAMLPTAGAAAPFALLITAAASIPLANPAPVFLVALLQTLALLWLSETGRNRALLPAVALGCLLALETVWFYRSAAVIQPVTALGWFAGLHGFFMLWPWLRRRQLTGRALPWAVSALSGIGHFLLIYAVMRFFYPDRINGLLPLAFSLPPLLGLAAAQRGLTLPGESRLRQLAWFGGVALFFITVAVPIQFRREWLTLSWALEGAALCWLFRRVPHQGLKMTGTVLLTVTFIRMGLNPAVFRYHGMSRIPFLNWHLYGYGITAASQFAAAWWLSPAHHRRSQFPLRAMLTTFGGILVFLLVNVQIANFFTPPGSGFITFEFHGNFARDMVTTIAWGLFALGLMMIGFRWRQPVPRYAGVGLLAVTLLKLFLHDLAQLGTIHRIGAFIAVALTALVASFLYQRFLNNNSIGAGGSRSDPSGSTGSTPEGDPPPQPGPAAPPEN